MGVELVQGTDLFVDESITYMKTTRGPEKVDIIYRRIDDKFLDPITFDSSSLIGIPGLFDSYKSGNVNICSAPGSGIADDKAIYSYNIRSNYWTINSFGNLKANHFYFISRVFIN